MSTRSKISRFFADKSRERERDGERERNLLGVSIWGYLFTVPDFTLPRDGIGETETIRVKWSKFSQQISLTKIQSGLVAIEGCIVGP